LNERGLEETYEWMKKFLAALVFLFCAVSSSFAAFFDRDNCDDIPLAQRVTFGTFCLQRTTAGGRTEGTTWIWNGSLWEQTGEGGGGGSGHIIEDEGTPLTQRATINVVGGGVAATDAGGKTVITVPGTIFEEEGTPVTQRSNVNVTGFGASVADSGGKTVITVPGVVVEDEGTPLTQRSSLNCTGTGITCSDSGGKTVLNVPGAGGSQIADNDLSAISALTGTGGLHRIGVDTWALRDLTGTTGNIVITNPGGVAGSPTFDVGTTVVQTDQSNTYTTGAQDFSAATSFRFPVAVGASPTTPGSCAYNSTSTTYRCGYSLGTGTLAFVENTQPLDTDLTQIGAITWANNQIPLWRSAGNSWTAASLLACSGANQSLNFDIATGAFGCVTHSGTIAGLTTGRLTKALSASTIGDSIISEAAGVATVGGGLVIGVGPYLDWNTSALTADRIWTVQNIAGIPLVATTEGGAITDTNIAIFKTTAGITRIVNGGPAGSGTWNDTSVNVGDNKTLVAVGAGGTNTLTIPIVASFDGAGLTPSSGCSNDASKVTINSGPTQYVLICPTAASAQFGVVIPGIKQAISTLTVLLKVNDVDSASQHFAGTFKAQCRASGTAPSSTWGSTQTVDITMTTANNTYQGLTAAITPNGTCSAGADLYIQFDASGSMTDDGDARIIGLRVAQAS
jgi:hypothetical protein